jgi:hypothetical protein
MFFEQAKRELKKSKNVDVEKVKTALARQQNFKPPPERVGGNQNQQGRERICALIAENLFDEGIFELRVERTENDFHKCLDEINTTPISEVGAVCEPPLQTVTH